MRSNPANALELVAASAAGTALARSMRDLMGGTPHNTFTYLRFIAAFLAGFSLFMGLRLWI